LANEAPGKLVRAATGTSNKPAANRAGKRHKDTGDWRSETIQRVREIVKEAIPDVVEEVKWRKPSNAMRGIPVWSHHAIICTGETYKNKVKLTFAKGAFLENPKGIFNASLEGNLRRALDIFEGDKIDKTALKALLRAAAACNSKNATPKR